MPTATEIRREYLKACRCEGIRPNIEFKPGKSKPGKNKPGKEV